MNTAPDSVAGYRELARPNFSVSPNLCQTITMVTAIRGWNSNLQ